MAVNQVYFGNETLMDITDTTAEQDGVRLGDVFYGANGERQVGTAQFVGPYTSDPAPLGNASPGSSDDYARGDHVHPKPSPSDVGAVNKTGDTMSGALNMGSNKITGLADGTNDSDAVNLGQMTEAIRSGASYFRGSFNTKAALMAVQWQTLNPSDPNYVTNNDYAIVQADESHNNECWRYIYVSGSGWTDQYKIDNTPLTQAQIDALNSGATAVKINKIATLESNVTELYGDISELQSAIGDGGENILAAYPTDTASGAVASFPDGAAVPVKSLVVNIEPVQSGSGDPAPDNVRPISGWTQAKVTRTGKNLLSLTGRTEASSPGYDPSSVRDFSAPFIYLGFTLSGYCNPAKINSYAVNNDSLVVNCNQTAYGIGLNVPAKPNTHYVFSFKNETQGESGVVFFGSDGKRTSAVYFNQPQNWAFTTPADCENMMIVFYPSTINTDKTFSEPQLELGSTDTAYEPYSGATITIDLDGTVYGGTLDVLTGVLTVTHKAVTYTGENAERWTVNVSSGIYRASTRYGVDDAYFVDLTRSPVIANIGKYAVYSNAVGVTFMYGGGGSPQLFYIPPQTVSDASSFKTWLASNNLQVVYPLATSVTYQLTAQEITTLLGDNNIWADTGDTTVNYRADTTLYIEKLTGSTEEDMIADAPIASGKYFLVGNRLFLSTASIAAGATLTPGTNCTETNLAAALNALNT